MSVTITKDNYPSLANGTGISGKRVILYLNYGENATADSPKWKKLGGLQNHTLSISGNISSVQTKESGYWADGAMTSKSAELSAECIMKRDNEAQLAIEEFMYDDEITAAKGALQVAIVDLDSKDYVKCWIIPSSWETAAESEDLVSKSLSATVVGAPVKATGFTAD